MSKVKIHEFELGIYPRRVWIANKCTKVEIDDAFCLRDGKPIDLPGMYEGAATVYPEVMLRKSGSYGVLVAINTKLNVGEIAHEAGHVATSVFCDIGSYLDPNNQEPFMYLLGYIAECIDKVIKNKFD